MTKLRGLTTRDNWLKIWNEGKLELVTETLGAHYVRHESGGTRTVTAEEFREAIAAIRKQRPDIHWEVEDEAITDSVWWVRWTMTSTDAETGEPVSGAFLQVYRVADGRIVETWVLKREISSTWN